MSDDIVSPKLGSCPIPRCALEWFLAILTGIMGFGFIFLPYGLQLDHLLDSISTILSVKRAIPVFWGFLLVLTSIYQIASLMVPIAKQHVAALATGIVWMFITVMVFQAGMVFLTIPAICATVGELYIALMLKP